MPLLSTQAQTAINVTNTQLATGTIDATQASSVNFFLYALVPFILFIILVALWQRVHGQQPLGTDTF